MIEYPYHHISGKVPPTMAKIPFFQAIDSVLLDEVLGHSALVDCDPGDVIIEEGSVSGDLFILITGRVRVEKDGQVLATIGQVGQLLGELSLIHDQARAASVIAASPVYCLRVSESALAQLKDSERSAYYAAVYRFLAKLLAERLEQTNVRLAEAEQKLAAAGLV